MGIDPLLSAEIERIASATLVIPARWRFSVVSTVTGEAVSVLARRKTEPVTTMSAGALVPWLVAVSGVCVPLFSWLDPATVVAG